MTPYKRGDVLLLPFPFTDALTEKRRPGVVVSTEAYMSRGKDVIVAMVTSQHRLTLRFGDFRISNWKSAGLIGPSVVRARLATIHSRRIVRKLGSVSTSDLAGIDRGLRSALGL